MRFPLVHPAVRLAIIVGTAVVALGAFLTVRAEDATFPLGTDSMIFVSETSLTDEQFADAMTAVAITHKVNFFKLTNQPDGGGTKRVLYVSTGDPSQTTLPSDGGYPDFDPSVRTSIRPITDLARMDPRGYYAISTTGSETHAIVSALDAESITAVVERRSALDGLLIAAERFPLVPVLFSLGLAIVAAASYTHAADTKSRAVLQVNGIPRARSLFAIVAQTACFGLVAGIAVTALALGVLRLYNDGNQSIRYTGAVWLGLLALFAFIALCQLVYANFSSDPPTARAIRGVRNLRGVAATGVAVAMVSLLAAASAAASTPGALEQRNQLDRASHAWSAQPPRAALRFGGALTNDDFESITPGVAQLYRELEREGLASLTVPGWPSAEGTQDFHPESGNTIIASPQYLSRIDVVGDAGREIREATIDASAVTLLIPSGAKEKSSEILRGFEDFFNFQASLDSGTELTARDKPRIDVQFTRSGQDLFNLQPGAGPSFQRDPVIAIVGASSNALSDNYYMAAASSQFATFDAGVDVPTLLTDRDLDRYIPSSYELREHVLARLVDQALTLGFSTAGSALQFTAAGLGVVLLSATLSYARRRVSFLSRINGHSWFRRNRLFLSTISALVASVAIVVLAAQDITVGRVAWVAASLSITSVIAVIAYAVCERRFSVRAPKE